MGLTDLTIRKLPTPAKGQKVLWEKGLGIRVSQGGSKTFVLKHEGRLITLGRYPAMSLKMARGEVYKVKAGLRAKQRIDNFREALTAFLDETATRTAPSTVEGYLHRLKIIKKEKLTRITVDDLPDTPQHRMAAKVFFNWCIRHELIDKNPFQFSPIKWTSRSRVLTEDELRQVWNYEYPPYSDYLKALILTGQRRGQWQNFTVDGNIITFPASSMKGGREHSIPASPLLLNAVGRLKPFNGWSKAKARIDKHVPIPHWTVHDLRRTFSTIMASLQVPLHVTEAILAHSSGQVSGVAATYNRYNYLIEMREAFKLYERHLKTVMGET